ncbi:hypothetical protein ACFW2G_13450 [Streptomyces sp. NPDC058880]|uniref:hypothetical protein n=1 Tax=Streptomyces sp. NPDC058880 TaxID=3346666 RepID=UPI0036BF6A7E
MKVPFGFANTVSYSVRWDTTSTGLPESAARLAAVVSSGVPVVLPEAGEVLPEGVEAEAGAAARKGMLRAVITAEAVAIRNFPRDLVGGFGCGMACSPAFFMGRQIGKAKV